MPWSSVNLGMVLGPVAGLVGTATGALNKELTKLLALKALLEVAIQGAMNQMNAVQQMADAFGKAGFYCIRLSPRKGSWPNRLRFAPNAPPDDPNGFTAGMCVLLLDPSLDKLVSTWENLVKTLDGLKEMKFTPDRVENKPRVRPPKEQTSIFAENVWISATLKDLMPGIFDAVGDVGAFVNELGENLKYALAQAGLAINSTMTSLNTVNDFMADLCGAGAYVNMLEPKRGSLYMRLESDAGRPPTTGAYVICGFCAVAYGPTMSQVNSQFIEMKKIFDENLVDGINIIQYNNNDSNQGVDTTKDPLNPPPETGVAITINPIEIDVLTDGTVQFEAMVTGPDQPDPDLPGHFIDVDKTVFWKVEGQGKINAQGLYTAPTMSDFKTLAPEVKIYAYPLADLSKVAGGKVTIIKPPDPVISVSINPAATTIRIMEHLQFEHVVFGTGNQGVLWEVVDENDGFLKGTITKTGLYTAPTYPTFARVRARSIIDESKFAESIITIVMPETGDDSPIIHEGATTEAVDFPYPGVPDLAYPDDGNPSLLKPWTPKPPPPPPPVEPPIVKMTIKPPYASLPVTATQQFECLTVNETKGVTWSVEGLGTIDANGLYTAPNQLQPIMANENFVIPDLVTATSNTDPTKRVTAQVFVIRRGPDAPQEESEAVDFPTGDPDAPDAPIPDKGGGAAI